VAERNLGGHAAPKTGLPRMAVAMAVAVALATLVALLWTALAAEAASPKATTKTFSNGNQIRIPADEGAICRILQVNFLEFTFHALG